MYGNLRKIFKGEKMKKKLTLLAALVLSIGMFSACGNNADKKEEAPKEETKVEEKAEEKTEERTEERRQKDIGKVIDRS